MSQTRTSTKITIGNTQLVLNSRSWGPMFIFGGVILLFFPIFEKSTNPTITIFKIIFSSVFVFVGIVVMLLQLRISDRDFREFSPPDAENDIEHAINQLNKNYEILRRQTTQGFIITGIFMTLGLLVILCGAFGKIFDVASSGLNLASISGIILEFISGSALVIYRLNFNQLNIVSDKLHSSWKYLTAFRKAETLQGDNKDTTIVSLINNFVVEKTLPVGKNK